MISTISPETFRQRFALATFDDGGVIVDTATGSYCRLNPAAAAICESMESSTDVEDAITRAATRLGVSQSTAAKDLRKILTELGMDGIRGGRTNPVQYEVSPEGGYDLCHEGARIFHVDAEGKQLQLIADLDALRFPIHAYIRHVVPKVAFLNGFTVLHGSAVVRDSHAMAICGVSGAGKTTTARILARYGADLVSEDLLVVAPKQTEVRIFLRGEQILNEWSAATAEAFESGERRLAETSFLSTTGSGPTVPLDSIWLLDASGRTDGHAIEKRRLPSCEALLRMLTNGFIGAAKWRRHLEMNRRLVAATEAYEINVPNTLDRLERALATTYRTK